MTTDEEELLKNILVNVMLSTAQLMNSIIFINSIDSIESMTTTISLSVGLKEKIRHLGKAGESYDDIIQRMYDATKSQLLKNYLYDTSDSIDINTAIKDARKRWQKS